MKTTNWLALMAAAVLAGCAEVGPLHTQSGNPEAIFPQKPDLVRTELMAEMAVRGFMQIQDEPNILTFSRTMQQGEELLYTLGMGNAYSSQPEVHIRFTLVDMGGGKTHVYGFARCDMTGAFGQSQSLDITHGKGGREVQQLLDGLSGNARS
jgi:hypothetical protein